MSTLTRRAAWPHAQVLRILISYSNGEPDVNEQKHVWAEVLSNKQLLPWSGPGSQSVHVQYPDGPQGQQTFDYIDRYAQGVTFDFEVSGRIWIFDWNYLISTLVVSLVLLSVAATITDFVAFSCLPHGHSAVLQAHRFETVSRKQGFASLAMRTGLAALQFKSFDPDNNKCIEADDLVRVLAATSFEDAADQGIEMNAETAHALALLILRDQVVAGESKASMVATNESYSFIDYMGTQDNGSLPFVDFLKYVKLPTGKERPSDEEIERCKKAFEEGKRQEGPMAKKRLMSRQLSHQPSSADSVVAIKVAIQKDPSVEGAMADPS